MSVGAWRAAALLFTFDKATPFDLARRLHDPLLRRRKLANSCHELFYALHGGIGESAVPLLPLMFSAGLSALKTPNHYTCPSLVR